MSFFNKLFIKFFYTKVGVDEFGNDYYTSNKIDNYGKQKRFVIYNGRDEPSKVPPMWHGWLHYMSNDIPDKDDTNLCWQKKHIPNLTGTKWSYSPVDSNNVFADKMRLKVSADYSRWQPNKYIRK
jgi:NADH:ubiquinone oxidoreductase subunit